MALNMAKTTISIPIEFKKELDSLKKELGVSVSSLIIEAVNEYKAKKERDKWEKGIRLAAERKLYEKNLDLKEWADFVGDYYAER